MSPNDLITLDVARNWLKLQTATDDAIVGRLVSAASQLVLNTLVRPDLKSRSITERRDGPGLKTRLMLREWPVTSVSSLVVDGVSIPAAVPGTTVPVGWLLEPWDGYPPGRLQAIDLAGYSFSRGSQNVIITYQAGYRVSDEAQVVTSARATVAAPFGPWVGDCGVKRASTGAAFTAVAGSPAANQYALGDVAGDYTFNAADEGVAVLVSYSYTPSDLVAAVMEIVGERYRYMARIGETSRSLAGQETAAFSQKDLTDFVRMLLNPYKRVAPV